MNPFAHTGTAARALLRSGVIAPGGPGAVLRTVRAVRAGGTNLATLLAVAAARWPGRTAIIDDLGALSYAQLHAAAMALARELTVRRGAGSGDSVGVMCRNGRGFIIGVIGAAAAGADVVLLNTDFRGDALRAALESHGIATVVCDDEFTDLVGPGALNPLKMEPVKQGAAVPVAAAGRMVLLTSGTTGTPKGVPRSPDVGAVAGIGVSIIDRARLHTGMRVGLAIPMFHAFGLAVALLALVLGGTILTRRRFDAEAALAQASLHRADVFAAVPIMLARILQLPDATRHRNPVPALRVVISGGSRLDPRLATDFMDAYGDILYNGYGSTEVGIGTFATPSDLRQAPETVGRPVAGCPVVVLDVIDRPAAPNETGRVFVGGDLAFDGYTGGGDKPRIDGMTATGDMGYLDERGRLFIVGREDDMIVSGGENVYPRAVENALAEYEGIKDSAVLAVDDTEYGHRLAAFVVSQAGIDTEALREYLRQRVSRFEQPRDIHVVDVIPRNPAGKVLRRELKRLAP